MPRTLSAAVVLSFVFTFAAYSQTQPPAPADSVPAAAGAAEDPLRQAQPPATAGATGAQPAVAPVATPPAQATQTAAAWWQTPQWWLVIAVALLACVTVAVAMFAARLWKSTAALLSDVRDTARKELRAYVALDEIFFTEDDEPTAAQHKLRIRNYGQTPASAMSIWCERASHLPQEGVKPFYDAPVVDGQLLHPVQAFTVGLASAPLYRLGKPGFFTYGRIIYHDIYKQWWVTKFCYRYEGDGSFVPHGDYNSEEGPFDKAPA